MSASGPAKQKFKQDLRLQGGADRVLDEPHRLPTAPFHVDVASPASGYISGADCERFGIAPAILGGGRANKEDATDHAVGLPFHQRAADHVEKAAPLAATPSNADATLPQT